MSSRAAGQASPCFPESLKRPDPSLSLREVSKKIAGSIHDVTILHNIKLMKEPEERSMENIGRDWQIYEKRSVKFLKESLRKFNLRKI